MARIRSIKPEFWSSLGVQDTWPFDCCIYIVQEKVSGPVKIGVARHPVRRLSALQGGNCRQLHLRAVFEAKRNDCLYIEKLVLRGFKILRNEWISAPPSTVEAFISQFEITSKNPPLEERRVF